MKKGIDVSKHNGVIDWEKVKGQVDYAIIRCGYGMNQENQDDQYFKRNVEECIRLGIPFGIYLYSYANTLEKADSEAEHILRLVNPYKDKVSMGIWYDIEDKIQANLDKNFLKDIITTFCNKIESNGYFVGIYANKNWLENRIEDSLKTRYAIWIAQYNSKCTWNGTYVMWQYTSDGSVDGISGRVDMNNLYRDDMLENGQTVTENATVEENQTVYTYKDFVGDVQKACGAKVDYIAGPETLSKTVTVSKSKNRKHAVVKSIQKYLYALGYTEVGDDDGIAGVKFDSAVKHYQRDNGCVVDGEITARNKTWKKLLKLA